MGLLILLQVVLDLGFIAVATLLLIERSKSKSMEDPRLSRGLQLLTSKIAILQDLMDRSETMSRQMTQLIDGKQQDIQERIEEVEIYLHKIQKATQQSKAVAEIFQDRIPHQEVIERQTTQKYIQAAKMAHQGFSADDIAKQLDIPRGELELIVKLNRDKIILNPEPSWAKPPAVSKEGFQEVTLHEHEEPKPDALDIAPVQATTMSEPLRSAISAAAAASAALTSPTAATSAPTATISSTVVTTTAAAAAAIAATTATGKDTPAVPARPKVKPREIRPVVFKRIVAGHELG